MKIKVFQTNPVGKIEFTPAELEKLLNDTYEEGQRNCNCAKGITWTNPYVIPYINTIDNEATTSNTSTPETNTITTSINAADAKEFSKHIDNIIKTATENNSVFSKLAKELNF